MNSNEILERIKEALKNLSAQIKDSNLYIQLKESFENLSPQMQKITMAGIIAFFAFALLYSPINYLLSADENLTQFQEQRDVIKSLLQVSKDAKDIPNIPPPPPIDAVRENVNTILQGANLMPEQIITNEISQEASQIVPSHLMTGALKVVLAKLNLRQILDIAHSLQNISQSVKFKDVQVQENSEKAGYYNAEFVLVSLNVPSNNNFSVGDSSEEEAPSRKDRFQRNRPKSQNKQEEEVDTSAGDEE